MDIVYIFLSNIPCRGKTDMVSKMAVGVILIVAAAAIGGYILLTSQSQQPVQITSGGASFPYPVITKWTSEYNKLYSNIQISYQSVGSGGGQKNLFEKTFDFAGSDAPLTDAQLANYTVVHIPETAGGVVITYNIPNMNGTMNLTADVIAQVFQGNITKWNDASITSLNQGLDLPNADIVVVRRSDSSGTTFVFTSYLANASSLWSLGAGTTVNWPVGLGGSGNSGVASMVQQTPYSIGYVEFFYAKSNSMPYASVQNMNGEFVEPSLSSIAEAARQGKSLLSADTGGDSEHACSGVYPISAFTYILVFKDLSYMTQLEATTIVNFIWWAIHDGQNYTEALYYPKLPSEIVSLGEAILRQITYQGIAILR